MVIHMAMEYQTSLHESVNQFKVWAKENYPHVTEDTDNGEWEIASLEFDDMCCNIVRVIEKVGCDEATEQMIDDILYGIARDNECGYIIDVLEDHPQWYSLLCRQCLKTNYTNAKWQFAESLKNYRGSDNLQAIIYDFLAVGDEYTERLALMSLAYIYPEAAEEYAIQFWNRNKYPNNEYQKIMVLHVLYTIHSAKLPYYLSLAEQSNDKYLKQNAVELRSRQIDQEMK